MINDIYITESDGKRKYVGEIDIDNKVFSTYRNTHKHLLKRYNAWAIDKRVVEELLVPNNVTINVIDRKRKRRYSINANVFHENAGTISFAPHRAQLYLNIEKWELHRYP